VAGNGEREGLKNHWIGQSAAKLPRQFFGTVEGSTTRLFKPTSARVGLCLQNYLKEKHIN
jgi:hypothetical protein